MFQSYSFSVLEWTAERYGDGLNFPQPGLIGLINIKGGEKFLPSFYIDIWNLSCFMLPADYHCSNPSLSGEHSSCSVIEPCAQLQRTVPLPRPDKLS